MNLGDKCRSYFTEYRALPRLDWQCLFARTLVRPVELQLDRIVFMGFPGHLYRPALHTQTMNMGLLWTISYTSLGDERSGLGRHSKTQVPNARQQRHIKGTAPHELHRPLGMECLPHPAVGTLPHSLPGAWRFLMFLHLPRQDSAMPTICSFPLSEIVCEVNPFETCNFELTESTTVLVMNGII